MNDLISRQAAIDSTQNVTLSFKIKSDINFENYRKEIQEILDNVLDAQKKALNGLPSAQTEIIRCKDCKHFEYDHPYIIQGVPVLGHEVCNAWGDGCKTDENGYCFMAERRTDE